MLSKKIAVIGLGNTLRRDDGIGIIILESLLNHYKREAIDYFNFGTSSFSLMHRLQDYDTALLIDGISAGLAEGELKIFALEEAAFTVKDGAVSSHELGLSDIFRLARNLRIKTRVYVAGIEINDAGFGESLSQPLKERVEEITRQVDKFIQERML